MSNRHQTKPKIDTLRGKERRIEVRVSDRELQIIDAAAERTGLNRSEYLRAKGLEGIYIKNRSLPDPDYAHLMLNYRELLTQGNNLNQIARALNAARSQGESVEEHLKAVAVTIAVNQQTLKQIQDLLSHKDDNR
jgi:Bacterial mobilisation protein (MobC)